MQDIPFDASHPNALAFYCSDGRFTAAVEELLRSLGHARLDTVTLPGGPALLNVLRAGFADLDTASRALGFLVRGHAIRHVVLLAHEGCGYYRARMATSPPAHVEATQREDLDVARRSLVASHPQVAVRAYFARTLGGKVRFDELE
jgi:hypothetical protein